MWIKGDLNTHDSLCLLTIICAKHSTIIFDDLLLAIA